MRSLRKMKDVLAKFGWPKLFPKMFWPTKFGKNIFQKCFGQPSLAKIFFIIFICSIDKGVYTEYM